MPEEKNLDKEFDEKFPDLVEVNTTYPFSATVMTDKVKAFIAENYIEKASLVKKIEELESHKPYPYSDVKGAMIYKDEVLSLIQEENE